MTSDFLKINAMDEYGETGRWAISVACDPGMSEEELVQTYRGRSYCVSDVGTVRSAGYDVLPDEIPHGLLKLGDAPPPDDEMEALWEDLRAQFKGPFPNPNYPQGEST